LSDDRPATIAAILANSEQIRTPREEDYIDGYADYG
jgi:hypothetical protein